MLCFAFVVSCIPNDRDHYWEIQHNVYKTQSISEAKSLLFPTNYSYRLVSHSVWLLLLFGCDVRVRRGGCVSVWPCHIRSIELAPLAFKNEKLLTMVVIIIIYAKWQSFIVLLFPHRNSILWLLVWRRQSLGRPIGHRFQYFSSFMHE